MNALDSWAIGSLNQFAGFSELLNRVLYSFQSSTLLTWVPVISLLWWAWFRSDGRQAGNRKVVVAVIMACVFVVAVFVIQRESKLLFRPRPVSDLQSSFCAPWGVELPSLDSYFRESGSFPSGHGAILAVITAGLLYVSRPVGVLCGAYSLVICLMRMFFGYHYFTDMIAGIVLGIAMFALANGRLAEKMVARRVLRWWTLYPSLFCAVLFIITFEIAEGFTESARFAHVLFHHISVTESRSPGNSVKLVKARSGQQYSVEFDNVRPLMLTGAAPGNIHLPR